MKIWLQKLMPQHALSRFMGFWGNCKQQQFKNWMIKKFIRAYNVDMSQAINSDPLSYSCFNDFFTRHLKPGQRHLDKPQDNIISPVDGSVSEFGAIEAGQLLQAKNQRYSLLELVSDANLAKDFDQGSFITLYLSPRDYHRIHMPIAGKLLKMIYVPGSLFSVNEAAVAGVPGLFAKNERAVCIFETEQGPMALILVGAMIVASIHTSWAGQVAPQKARQITEWDYSDQDISFQRGDEMGYFQMGSTVILLFPQDTAKFIDSLAVGDPIRLGDHISTLIHTSF